MRGRRVTIPVALLATLALLVPAAGAQDEPVAEPGPPPPALPGLLPVPDPLPPGAPGDVIASAPFPGGSFPFAVEGHQILFRSTDRFGAAIAVSGYILVPTGVPVPPGGRAVVAWAHGTAGLVDGCALSISAQHEGRLNSPDSYDRIDQILAAGHIVTASDYPGLGTPGLHPYLDGLGEGRSVLDSIRAAATFGATNVAVIEGFSQGSQAAIFAGAEWPTYAPDIDLRGVVPIGTPSLFGAAFAARYLPVVDQYLGKVLAGIVAGRPDLDRTQILTLSGERAYDRFAARDRPNGFCVSPSFDWERDLATDPMDVPPWRAAFEANYPGQRPVPVPVLMVQSASDEQALVTLADGVCRDLQANGTDVRMWRYDDEDHVATVTVSSDDRARWILHRLEGRPVTNRVGFTGETPRVMPSCAREVVAPEDPPPPVGPVAAAPGFTG